MAPHLGPAASARDVYGPDQPKVTPMSQLKVVTLRLSLSSS
jgi:hypothetical protein